MCVGCGRFAFDDARSDGGGDTDADSRGWWDRAWSRRIKLTFNNPGPAVSDVPVLVRLDGSRIDYNATKSDGSDLRFVDADGTLLAHEIENWRTVDESNVWVRVPQVDTSSADYIWLYYDNQAAPVAEDPDKLWIGNVLVWHLGEDPSGMILDSSLKDNDGTSAGGMTLTAQGPGTIGGSLGFDGVDDWINAPSTPSLTLTTTVTMQMWIYVVQRREQWLCDYVFPVSETEVNNHLYELSIDPGDLLELHWEYGAGLDGYSSSTVPLVNTMNAWTLITVVRDSAAKQVRYYENGALLGTTVAYPTDASGGGASSFWLGGVPDNTSAKVALSGRIDEVRVSNLARSTAYIALDYRSMTDALITYGAPEAY